MRGKIIVGLVALSIIVIAVAIKMRPTLSSPRSPAQNTEAKSAASSAQDLPESTSAATAAAPLEAASVIAPSDPQFQQWIREEAKSLDQPSAGGQEKEAQIRAVVSKITPAQSRQLRQTVNNPRSLPREKILSAYLLVEGGLSTRQDLKDSISAPLTEKGGEAHSEDELKGIREKSLRIMMIDGLFAQAKNDPQARATLAQAIADSEDPYIKAYAQEKLDQLSHR